MSIVRIRLIRVNRVVRFRFIRATRIGISVIGLLDY